MNPILFVDLFKQSSYKTTILLSVTHKQLTYFSKKYSKSTRITLSKTNKLSVACKKNNIKAIKYIQNLSKYIALHNTKIIRYLLLNNISDIKHISAYYFGYLDYNPKYEYIMATKLLFDKGGHTYYYNRILEQSAIHGSIKVIKFLLDKKVDMWKTNHFRIFTNSIHYGHIDIVKLLLERVPDVCIDNNTSALNTSINFGRFDILKLLLNHGFKIHDKDKYSFILDSVSYGHIDIVRFLLENYIDMNTNYDFALKLSIRENHLKIADLLLEYGANIHAIDIMLEPKIRIFVEEKQKIENNLINIVLDPRQ